MGYVFIAVIVSRPSRPAHRTKKEEEKETERKKEYTCVYFEKSVNKSDKISVVL